MNDARRVVRPDASKPTRKTETATLRQKDDRRDERERDGQRIAASELRIEDDSHKNNRVTYCNHTVSLPAACPRTGFAPCASHASLAS